MPHTSYEIRICESCGLRYPLVADHVFGTRCPICMGSTQPVIRSRLVRESQPGAQPGDAQSSFVEARDGRPQTFSVLLDNIRSAWNVGSILRSADGFGFRHAYLCGITPAADQEAVRKTSLGAEASVPWSYHKDAVRLVTGLKKERWKMHALEDDPRALPVRHASSLTGEPEANVLILGSEVTGVDPGLLDLCDSIFYIPMRGQKKSFNVAIAFSIAAYALTVQQA